MIRPVRRLVVWLSQNEEAMVIKSKSTQTRKSNVTPNMLSKVGKQSGIELSEPELGQVTAGEDGTRYLKVPHPY